MAEETLVAAADIARLAGVGRSAVSNWRRRYAGFPQPVAGTSASPLFALAEVEAWLRAQGRLLEVPLVERAWQELRVHAGDDPRLASALADAGERLVSGQPAGPPAVAELAAAIGPADTFEVLLSRFHETRARGTAVPDAEIAGLMAAFVKGAVTVLDPACGTGELLLAAGENGARRLLGQDAGADLARLAGIRLRLGPVHRGEASETGEAIVRKENALFRDAFPGIAADAVLCCPPSYPRVDGQELSAADERWVYGVPPRMEPELAWVQHALAHLSPTGLAVVLMPQAAAARRPGRRIRAQLLRKGALRAVIALPTANQLNHLWVLRCPADEVPATVLMMAVADPSAVTVTWRRFTGDPRHEEPGVSRAVPVIDLLDDEVDLNPARHLPALPAERTAERFAETRDGLAAVVTRLPRLIPDLRPAGRPRSLTFVTVAELARTGQVEVHQAPVRADSSGGSAPLLTADDVIESRPPSGRGQPSERWVTVRAGDIVVVATADRLTARVVTAQGAILGPGLALLRVDPERLDAHFVAGALRSSANGQAATRQTGSSGRADISRARIAQLPLAEQRPYAEAFRQAEELEAAARTAAAIGTSLAQLLADGISGGTLEPLRRADERPESRLKSAVASAAAKEAEGGPGTGPRRPVHTAQPAGPWRHGPGMGGPGHPAQPEGGREAAHRGRVRGRPRLRPRRPPVHPGGHGHRPAGAPERAGHLRCRDLRRRPLPGHGTRRRLHHRRPRRRARAASGRLGSGDRRPGRRGTRHRSSARDPPPGHQAAKCHADQGRHREGPGLRRRGHRQPADHEHRRGRRYPRVHGPRAAAQPSGNAADRPVRPRLPALRDAGGPAGLHRDIAGRADAHVPGAGTAPAAPPRRAAATGDAALATARQEPGSPTGRRAPGLRPAAAFRRAAGPAR